MRPVVCSHVLVLALAAVVRFALVPSAAEGQTVQTIANQNRCSTSGVVGISRQLADTQMCMNPGAFVRFAPAPGVVLNSSSIHPYLQATARDALHRAARSVTVRVNSAFRTLADQYVLYHADSCYRPALPGNSNHQSGRALDVSNASTIRSAMEAQGCRWFGSSDPVHFDCPGADLRSDAVRAFQRLWNLNNPGDPIAEDGSYGPITASRLSRSPASGFAMDGCAPVCTPSPEGCNDIDDDCDGRVDEGEACEVALLQREPSAYAPPILTDIDGDGTADVCARGYTGVRCWPSTGVDWSEAILATAWGDDAGWDDVANYATLRMADLDGDRLADLCARANDGLYCATSLGDSFGESSLWLSSLSDDAGWDQPDNYTTIRLADIDGDGRADVCARANAGMRCWISEGSGFGAEVVGPAWSDDSGFDEARHYGTIRTGDLDGDGLTDLCARTAEGFDCYSSEGTGFGPRIEGPRWSNEQGWGAMRFWSTIRLADIDGDGRDDVCARSSTDLRCHRSLGDRFEETPIVMAEGYADESGWDDESNFATLRVGDIDADGRDDLCLRANRGIRCLRYSAEDGVTVEGPAWGDDSGWDAAHYYSTFRLADFDGDGLTDFCARASNGWRCHPSTGDGFLDPIELGELTNDGGWDSPQYWTTIQSGGTACRSALESCNGADDDCDGEIDENARAELCNGADDDCDGDIDEGTCDAVDAGVSSDGSTSAAPTDEMGEAGCSCRSGPGRGSVGALLVTVALLSRRRRKPA